MLRIIDKKTKLFLRDDFTYDEDVEIGLDVEPAKGIYMPKWDGEKWIETGQAPEPTPQELTENERLDNLENTILMLLMTGG